jgi:RNA polymerase sigma-70 factor (ECF subfamily)
MQSKVVDEINEPQTEIVSFDDSAAREEALVVAAKGGDGLAFEILVGRFQQRILHVVLRFTRNREDAEDIVQQSFQKAFVHLRGFEGNSSFSTWLTRIAINEALMWLRRKRASPEVPIEESGTKTETALPLDFPDSGPNPEDRYSQQEWGRMLHAAMNELTPGMRTAVELRELGELSTEETARVMGLSVGAVKSRVFHGRRKLREVLKRYVESTWKYGNQALRTSRKANGFSRDQFAVGV